MSDALFSPCPMGELKRSNRVKVARLTSLNHPNPEILLSGAAGGAPDCPVIGRADASATAPGT
ncbi:hypothetical protein PZ897_06380 [Hoeflea sp. YIM 152468]|uniref:hypothetical protein n=1 Tax=Hoeflea sp. YIM 152468 TaxID=3031759 RepID=UPI0023DC3CB8|nr:hypothetical protein [Hoeflea sp. YIM 152468]MDF1607799.1 hypothetical protein [Hoeflea sp. YIM 152468]